MTKPDLLDPAQRAGAPAPSAAPPYAGRITTTLAATVRLTGAPLSRWSALSRSERYRLLAVGRLRAVMANRRTLILWGSVLALAYLDGLSSATFRGPRPQPSWRTAP